ncbi:hypothetical protein ACFE04_002631 [Oxalis oulophora]
MLERTSNLDHCPVMMTSSIESDVARHVEDFLMIFNHTLLVITRSERDQMMPSLICSLLLFVNMFGFRLHIGGKFYFEHPISYVGGAVVDDWDIDPDCLTLDTLNRAINIIGQKGFVLTIHYNKPGNILGAGLSPVETNVDVHSLVTPWKEIDFGSEEEHGSDFDEEWLDDVEYGSENKNEELNEYLQKAKGFIDESATRGTGEEDSDKDYSIGMYYEDDEELNWSLSDEDLPAYAI